MRRIFAVGIVVGLFLIVFLVASLQGAPVFSPPDFPGFPPPNPLPTTPEQTAGPGEMTPPPVADNGVAKVGAIVMLVLAAAVAALLLFLLVRWLLRLWRERTPRRREGAAVGAESDTAVEEESARVAQAVHRGLAGAIVHIDAHERSSDAIIAAWLGLEESATDAGVTRGTSETPAEFALRIVTRRVTIGDDAQRLLRLYERVRFGGYDASDDDRHEARQALERLEEAWR